MACVRGTAFGGLRCTIVAEPPKPPTVEAEPDERCTPGEKQWCDGLQYSGWGQITCQQDGRWPTRTINGKAVKDCQELSSGARPDTLCACYHPYGGALECCERADCKVVRRDDGSESTQICPKSGGTGCEYCSPQKKQCGSQRTCAITKSGEAYCTEPCGFLCTCPEGYSWEMVGETAYCLPEDRSCYY